MADPAAVVPISSGEIVTTVVNRAVLDATPQSIAPLLARLVALAPLRSSKNGADLVGTNEKTGVSWALASFVRSGGADEKKMRFLGLKLAVRPEQGSLEARRESLKAEFSKQLGKPRALDADEKGWLWAQPGREIIVKIVSAHHPVTLVAETVVLVELGVPQGEPD